MLLQLDPLNEYVVVLLLHDVRGFGKVIGDQRGKRDTWRERLIGANFGNGL